MGRKLTKPKHEHGKSTGFTRFPDGSIELCPMYTDNIEHAIAEEKAIKGLLALVTSICQERLVAVEKTRDVFWKRVAEDVGISLEEPWQYKLGRLFRIPAEDSEGDGLPK